MRRLGLTEGRRRLQEAKYFDTEAMYQDYPNGFKVGRVTVTPDETMGGLRIDDDAYAIGLRDWCKIMASGDGYVIAKIQAGGITEARINEVIAELKKCQKEMAEINSIVRKYQK